jgi:ribosomal protein L7/L12
MDMHYLEELLAYVLGTVLSVNFFALLIITCVMFARQKNTTSKPNEYLADRLVFYSCGYTKKLKVIAMITFSGYLVILPTAIAYGVGRAYLEDRAWIAALIAFGIGLLIMFLIGRQPFCFKESCLIIDEQKVTVKYKDGEKEDKVCYVSQYDHFSRETRNLPPKLIFAGYEGEEILSLHFLRSNDAVTAGKMVEFIKKTGRVPVVQQVASKQEAQQKIAERYQKDVEAFAKEQQELVNDAPRYKSYLEKVLDKIPDAEREKIAELVRQGRKIEAIKEAREYTGEGLRIAKDLVDRYF